MRVSYTSLRRCCTTTTIGGGRRDAVVSTVLIPTTTVSSSSSTSFVTNHHHNRKNESLHQYYASSYYHNTSWSHQQQQQPPQSTKYESYEYPWATEPPIITRMTAKEAEAKVLAAAAAAAAAKDALVEQEKEAVIAAKETLTETTATTSSTNEKQDPSTTTTTPPPQSQSDTSIWSMLTSFVSNIFSPNTTTTSSMSSFSSLSVVPDDTNTETVSKNTMTPSMKDDPFDDAHTLTLIQIEDIRKRQQQELAQLPITLEPVTKTVPSYVPQISSNKERPVPETIVTTLDNGLRIVSQETYGHVSTIGIVSTMGSRYENQESTGVTNMMELLAFGTTDLYEDNQHVAQQLQEWLGTRFVHTGREQSMYGIDVLRPNVAQACEMIADVVLRPHFTNPEIDHAKETIHYLMTHEDLPQEFVMSEAINVAAFGMDQQLGQPHGCPIPKIPKMNRSTIQQWYQSQMIQNPKGLVFGGAGIDHDTLVRLGEEYFGHLQQNDTNRNPWKASTYRGGSKIVTLPTPMDGGHDLSPEQYSVVHREKRLTRVALGLEVGGWHSDNLVAICVLQSLLGGGSSFSAGGPGKGMYSRLYRQILNRYHWAESAEAFTSFHNEAGLMGITGRADAKYATDMVKTFCIHLKRLAVEPVTEEELDRARNMLRNDVMTQLESRFVLFEDMSRQVLTFGKREHVTETVAKIDAVTAEQIQAIVAQAIVKPPTFCGVGVDVQYVPPYEQVCEWLRR